MSVQGGPHEVNFHYLALIRFSSLNQVVLHTVIVPEDHNLTLNVRGTKLSRFN